MVVAAFVPIASEEYLRCILPRYNLTFARSWWKLGSLIDTEQVKAAIIDPSADGMPDSGAAARILETYPRVYTLAYLAPTPENLKAVFELSKSGLQDVFLHPVPKQDLRLAHALERAEGNRLGEDLLSTVHMRLALLPPAVARAVFDVFQRPHRYHTACDIADEASVPSRRLYAWLKRAGLPTPKKLLIVAKAIHGYSYLRRSNRTVSSVTHKLGYSDARVFARHVSSIFRCDPAALRIGLDSEEVMLDLLESMSKPSIYDSRDCQSISSLSHDNFDGA
ncbi:MAG: hypothetical protein M3037_03065 [Gemmatimonadota bacterium]|nr:hypothetical protein [Gemmatimonadota bacterium]